MDQYIGKMLDNRYEILERIGTGGMAVVYKAKCHRLNRLVAVKILKSDLAQDDDFRRRFNAESQAVAQLSHPNIVSVYDVSRGGDMEYIVMELIDGITLKQYMEKRGQLNWRETLHFITQIIRGLSHAHSRGIVHRDIKPQNIMVLRDGSVKVADFGIACLENAAQTLTQEALGSVHYISPEQARGDRTGARSDLYSAGVVLYEMLTGRLPFEGDSAVSVAIQHLSSIPLAPREVNPDIPEQLELICMKAMAPDLDKRYPDAEAMIADLESFRKNPGASLDFELSDLRPSDEDEPTRPLRISAARDGAAGGHRTGPIRTSSASREREYRRDYDDDYDDYAPSRRNSKQTALVIVAVLLAVALAFTFIRSIVGTFDGGQQTDSYTVKRLTGMTVEEARELEGIKEVFEIEVSNEVVYSDTDDDKGLIVRQEPEEGTILKGGNLKITVWVSAGVDQGQMLDVTNRSIPYAKAMLKDLMERYELEIVEPPEEEWVFNDEVEKGSIISTSPAEGEPLNRGDTIVLVVSNGPRSVKVPPFTGLQLEGVLNQLATMGLERGEVEEVFSDQPVGMVVEQDPAADSDVPEGTKVNFKVSKGPENSGAQHSDTVTFDLPTNKESGYLKIYQDGELIFQDTIICTSNGYPYVVYANGETRIQAYLDDELIYDQIITVDGNNE
ncbi:MAG: Stk1 family PASTA domain-containing Ser/Thr kinase [Oscillibacter sp.]|nr:Stk1 family PASTA domain-containing Ser/Thr kinase [Oscillibacter sp.]